jgi:hypothetical protein
MLPLQNNRYHYFNKYIKYEQKYLQEIENIMNLSGGGKTKEVDIESKINHTRKSVKNYIKI